MTAAQRQEQVKRVVLVSSIGADDPFFPLNALWGVLFWKKRGEEAVQRSGIPYTIVRPPPLPPPACAQNVQQKSLAGGVYPRCRAHTRSKAALSP